MKHVKVLLAMLAVCLLVAAGATNAHAAKKKKSVRGLYAGFGVGLSEFEHDDAEAFAWRAMGWLRVCKYASLEFSYLNSGELSGQDEVDGLQGAIVPMLPITEQLTLLAKVGGLVGTRGGSTEEELTYGFGAMFDLPDPLPETMGIRIEWERLEESAVDTFTIGPFYQFVEFGKR
ncbi:MAG: hypothetical protein D6760_11525 [Deltaproteobacteria bacterium]|nr:MAG: hypothetical protein D6760_11525 [Deltaproteobacteria bacterium]